MVQTRPDGRGGCSFACPGVLTVAHQSAFVIGCCAHLALVNGQDRSHPSRRRTASSQDRSARRCHAPDRLVAARSAWASRTRDKVAAMSCDLFSQRDVRAPRWRHWRDIIASALLLSLARPLLSLLRDLGKTCGFRLIRVDQRALVCADGDKRLLGRISLHVVSQGGYRAACPPSHKPQILERM